MADLTLPASSHPLANEYLPGAATKRIHEIMNDVDAAYAENENIAANNSLASRYINSEAPANAIGSFSRRGSVNATNAAVPRGVLGSARNFFGATIGRAASSVAGTVGRAAGKVGSKVKHATRKVGRVTGLVAPHITNSNTRKSYEKLARFKDIMKHTIPTRRNQETLTNLWEQINTLARLPASDERIAELSGIAHRLERDVGLRVADHDVLKELLYFVLFLMEFKEDERAAGNTPSYSVAKKATKKVGNIARPVLRAVGVVAPKIADTNVSTEDAKMRRFAQLESIILHRGEHKLLDIYRQLKTVVNSSKNSSAEYTLSGAMESIQEERILRGVGVKGRVMSPNQDIYDELYNFGEFLTKLYFTPSLLYGENLYGNSVTGAGNMTGGRRRRKTLRHKNKRI